MIGLSGKDLEAVLASAQTVSLVSDPDDFAPIVLPAVAALVRSDITTLNEVDPAAGRLIAATSPSSVVYPDGVFTAFERLAHGHPLIAHFIASGDGSARKISDVWSTRTWHDSELYDQVYRRLDVEFQMSITLPAPLPIVVGIAVNRASGDFSERDRLVLNAIRPHLSQAWRNAREQQRLRSMVDTAAGVLQADGSGVIMLSDPMHELTPGALVELYRFFGRPGATDPLPARVVHWLETEREGAAAAELARPLSAALGQRRLVLRRLARGVGEPDAILVRESLISQAATSLAALGLSPRETEVVQQLTTGATNAAIAEALQVTPATVKKHLDHVYAKLGVTGRVQAVAVALDVLGHHGGG
jgi:DNA-binding CsgD family transcriptional regulator